MTEHTWHGPKDHKPGDNIYDDCVSCVLSHCTVCGGAEASLPKDCPGVSMSSDQQDAVQAGRLDYIGGIWVIPLHLRRGAERTSE